MYDAAKFKGADLRLQRCLKGSFWRRLDKNPIIFGPHVKPIKGMDSSGSKEAVSVPQTRLFCILYQNLAQNSNPNTVKRELTYGPVGKTIGTAGSICFFGFRTKTGMACEHTYLRPTNIIYPSYCQMHLFDAFVVFFLQPGLH